MLSGFQATSRQSDIKRINSGTDVLGESILGTFEKFRSQVLEDLLTQGFWKENQFGYKQMVRYCKDL
jgi:hypothetical protein